MQFRRTRQEWLADLRFLGASWLLAFTFVLLVHSDSTDDTPPILWELVVWGLFTGLVLVLRRRRPVLLAILAIITEIIAAGGIGLSGMAVANLAVRRGWTAALPVTALHIVVVGTLWGLADTEGSDEFWLGVTIMVLVHITLVTIGLLIRSQRMLLESARERARQAEEGQRLRVEEARHNERERLAREMHDVLAHRISLLAVHAGALEFRGKLPPEEERAAGVIRQCAHDALEDLRDVITMLRDDEGAGNGERPQPTLTDIPSLVEQSREAGAKVDLSYDVAEEAQVPQRIGRHAYRIVQEGLTNARKHAPGAKVEVAVKAPPGDGLTIEVANLLPHGAAPTGLAGLPGAGAGLIGLGERVGLVGGRLEHGRTPQGDFRLRAWLPLPG